MKVVFAERAQRDIGAVYDWIAPNSPRGALRVEMEIRMACERLSHFPFASMATDVPGIRRLPLSRYPYTIFFRVDEVRDLVEIARVVHSARVRDIGTIPDDAS